MDQFPLGVIAPYDWGSGPIPSVGDAPPDLDRLVEGAMRQYGIVGCGVSLSRADSILCAKGYGYAELPARPFLPTTASRCASLTKPVAAACALMLFDEGKLDLDARMLEFFPDVKSGDPRSGQILVRHLMDHSSGIPVTAPYTAWLPNRNLVEILGRKPTPQDVAKDAIENWPLHDEPGRTYQYANANFIILGRIIEKVVGRPFLEHLPAALSKFGIAADEVFVSRDQLSPDDPMRGANEAAYYQTSAERYGSFLPSDASKGPIFGEAYRGFSTECSDCGGGIAMSAIGIAKFISGLRGVLSLCAMGEILDSNHPGAYSKGFVVSPDGMLGHTGMTNHCGGNIGHRGDVQYMVVCNWNNSGTPYLDAIMSSALSQL